ncbi:hypothetical protein [Agarilytica rhodophyticola]|uniref:hypothetical protein n=1 Tax=Agarilytica rhodophyticola TaxID=1737490 RepID=UPI000B348FAB|nr:hypothetical protein [Agarilytica rhodophyticola]
MAFLVSSIGLSAANEHDTLGNFEIKDINIWDDRIDVYLVDGQQHKCLGELKTRFLISPDKQVYLSAMPMVFAVSQKINFAYNCDPDN